MRHPFERFSARQFRCAYFFFLAATIVLCAVLASIGRVFSVKQGPKGESYDVVAFELARSPQQAAAMIAVWGEDGVEAAKWNTRLDYLFLCCYPNLLALGLLAVVSGRRSGPWLYLGRGLAWGLWGAATADAIENTALLRVLAGHAVSPWPETAFCCACLKFTILAAALAFLIAALPLAFRARSSVEDSGQAG